MTAVLRAQARGTRYKQRRALSDCTLDVPAGRVVGLVGPDGAGRSTPQNLAAGMLTPTSGAIEVCGSLPADGAAQLAKVCFVAQDTPTYAGLSIEDHLRLAAHLNPGRNTPSWHAIGFGDSVCNPVSGRGGSRAGTGSASISLGAGMAQPAGLGGEAEHRLHHRQCYQLGVAEPRHDAHGRAVRGELRRGLQQARRSSHGVRSRGRPGRSSQTDRGCPRIVRAVTTRTSLSWERRAVRGARPGGRIRSAGTAARCARTATRSTCPGRERAHSRWPLRAGPCPDRDRAVQGQRRSWSRNRAHRKPDRDSGPSPRDTRTRGHRADRPLPRSRRATARPSGNAATARTQR
ncbi:ABC transporter related protein (plasmid) [Streptantibioticus cattleyicolor NRRL 8057 = DSM 46488]|uniref:ABC transporter related protein n=1 Tax=Streptantibioticus cattleyicolor (strain ATCC 35852 / DSM 46488 / JCM 4925 / NBRC 14057 / NRRL 8057) TaxID=1003195 RepID=G8XGG5_STREN|nr:ABC transporter related protein [Streptantibioticus cattleyicolor NRRL 8057 = DSM 46488]